MSETGMEGFPTQTPKRGILSKLKETLLPRNEIPCGIATAASPEHGNQDVCVTKEFTDPKTGKRKRVVLMGDGTGGSFYGRAHVPTQDEQDRLIASKTRDMCNRVVGFVINGKGMDDAVVAADVHTTSGRKHKENPSVAALMAVIIDTEGDYEIALKGDLAAVTWSEKPYFHNRNPNTWGIPTEPKRSNFQIQNIPDNSAQKAHVVRSHMNIPSGATGDLDIAPGANEISTYVGRGEQKRPAVQRGKLNTDEVLLIGTDGMRLSSEIIESGNMYSEGANKLMRDMKAGIFDAQTTATQFVNHNLSMNNETYPQRFGAMKETDDMTVAILTRPEFFEKATT